MNDFNQRFSVALGILGFGVAGFFSIFVGSEIFTALIRSLISGMAMFLFGKLLAAMIYEGPPPPVIRPRKPPEEKK